MKKKNESKEKTSNKKKKVMTPEEIFNEEIAKKEEETKTHFILLEQINLQDEEGEEEEEEEDEDTKLKKITIERLRSLNHIYIPESTFKKLESLEDQIESELDPDGSGIIMTNTSSSLIFYDIFNTQQAKIKKFLKDKKFKEAFDLLFPMTLLFKEHQTWYRDTEDPDFVNGMMETFGNQWKLLLKEEIGISTQLKENWKKHLANFWDQVDLAEGFDLKKWTL